MGIASVDFISWWGAGLSTLLAAIKLVELWHNRFRIEIGYRFTGDKNEGNDVYIRNLSRDPILLEYWELFYRPRLWPLRKESIISSCEGIMDVIRIAPHSSVTLNFIGINHFDWQRDAIKGQRIHIRLYIVGRRPIIKAIYG